MPTKQEVIENLNWTTARVSDRVWTISVGTLAASLSYIIESTSADGAPFLEPREVAMPAVLALLALCADLAQYVAAHRQNVALLRKMEAARIEEALYDAGSAMRRLRSWAYNAKIALCTAAALWITSVTALRALDLMRSSG